VLLHSRRVVGSRAGVIGMSARRASRGMMMKRQIQMRYMQMALCDAQVARRAPQSARLVLGCSVLNGEVRLTIASLAGRPPSSGKGGDVPLDLDARRGRRV
jgi:hypothetical protein